MLKIAKKYQLKNYRQLRETAVAAESEEEEDEDNPWTQRLTDANHDPDFCAGGGRTEVLENFIRNQGGRKKGDLAEIPDAPPGGEYDSDDEFGMKEMGFRDID